MAWSGLPAGATSVYIAGISPSGDKFIGARFDGEVDSPWAWSEAAGNSTLSPTDIVVSSGRVARNAAMAIYPSSSATSGVFRLWDGTTTRTFSTLTGRDTIVVEAVSPNGDHAVLRMSLGSAFTFYAAKNLLTYLATGSGLVLHELVSPAGYNGYLVVSSVSNNGVVYGRVTTTTGIKQVFTAPSNGTVSIVTDSAFAAGVDLFVHGDGSGADRISYYLRTSPYYTVREYSGAIVDRTPTYGAYVSGTNGATLFGGLGTDVGDFVPAKCVGGTWAALSTSSGVCYWVSDAGKSLVITYEDGVSRASIDDGGLTELPALSGWPATTAYDVTAWSADLSALVVYVYDEASAAEAAFFWTADSGYVSLAAQDAQDGLSASLVSTATISATLKVGARFACALSASSTLTAKLPQLEISLSAALVSNSETAAALTTAILLNSALGASTSLAADLNAGTTALNAAFVSSASVSAALSTEILFAAELAAHASVAAALTVPTGFQASAVSSASIAAALSTDIRLSSALSSRCSIPASLSTAIYAGAALSARSVMRARLLDRSEGAFHYAVYLKPVQGRLSIIAPPRRSLYVR